MSSLSFSENWVIKITMCRWMLWVFGVKIRDIRFTFWNLFFCRARFLLSALACDTNLCRARSAPWERTKRFMPVSMFVSVANFWCVRSARGAALSASYKLMTADLFYLVKLVFWTPVQVELSGTLQCRSLCRSRSARHKCAMRELIEPCTDVWVGGRVDVDQKCPSVFLIWKYVSK